MVAPRVPDHVPGGGRVVAGWWPGSSHQGGHTSVYPAARADLDLQLLRCSGLQPGGLHHP